MPITSVEEVTLYDCNTYVILPATAEKECSMVELMASEEQPPHYFVSHWWGEPIVDFLRCLRRHAEARRLEYKVGWHNGEKYDPEKGKAIIELLDTSPGFREADMIIITLFVITVMKKIMKQ